MSKRNWYLVAIYAYVGYGMDFATATDLGCDSPAIVIGTLRNVNKITDFIMY